MVTKSVVACVVSGALMSTFLPGSLSVTHAHAQQGTETRAAKVSRTRSASQLKGVSARHERTHSLPVGKKLVRAKASTSFSLPARQQTAAHKLTTRHLGAFAVRAYTHLRRPGTTPSKTATGTIPTTGRTVAVDPRVIPLGTKIHIEGVGERIAEDSGGRIKGKRLDLFLPSVEHCRQFGVQLHAVQVLAE